MYQSRQVRAANSTSNECPGVSMPVAKVSTEQHRERGNSGSGGVEEWESGRDKCWVTGRLADSLTVRQVDCVYVDLVYKASTFRIQKLNGAT